MMDTLDSARLHLRRIRAEDAEAIFTGWAQDPEVTRYLTWDVHRDISVTREIVALWLFEYLHPPVYRYGICLSGTDRPIGMIDVVRFQDGVPEIGYVLSRQHWGHGYMTEACQLLLSRLRQDGYPLVRIRACQANAASLAVIRKCGFRRTHDAVESLSPERPLPVPVSWFELSLEGRHE